MIQHPYIYIYPLYIYDRKALHTRLCALQLMLGVRALILLYGFVAIIFQPSISSVAPHVFRQDK
jgi:hypothetical protein